LGGGERFWGGEGGVFSQGGKKSSVRGWPPCVWDGPCLIRPATKKKKKKGQHSKGRGEEKTTKGKKNNCSELKGKGRRTKKKKKKARKKKTTKDTRPINKAGKKKRLESKKGSLKEHNMQEKRGVVRTSENGTGGATKSSFSLAEPDVLQRRRALKKPPQNDTVRVDRKRGGVLPLP